MEFIAAGLMVSLTMIVIASRGQGKDTSILWASVLISVSMVLTSGYRLPSRGRVGRRGELRGPWSEPTPGDWCLFFRPGHSSGCTASILRQEIFLRSIGQSRVAGAAISATVLFLLIDASVTSTSFMRDYGGQWAAGLYSTAQYLYIGAVMASAGWTCVRFRKAWTTIIYTAAFALCRPGTPVRRFTRR